MAKFLDTAGVSYYLQQLINSTNDKLILISPFLKVSERLKQSIEDKDRMKLNIRLIYGKNDLDISEHNWLKSLNSVRTSFCQNLHAKCYLNEKEAIITSMNLYDFSQINNNEMGIYVTKDEDSELYTDIYNEAMRLVRISDEIKVSVIQIPKTDLPTKPQPVQLENSGYCVRCGTEIKLNPKSPYCSNCYKLWKKFSNDEYEEKYCHICKKENKSTLVKPTCYDCYKANKNKLEFPLQK
ncbi:MAG: phospholipase D family protein [Dehalococcoidales bacterium]|nr:phospholipase D family protein [Dehalococcoidales bacterium]MDZ4230819.1 phospholipase D family protein [Dehalococcoidales bacterium]